MVNEKWFDFCQDRQRLRPLVGIYEAEGQVTSTGLMCLCGEKKKGSRFTRLQGMSATLV